MLCVDAVPEPGGGARCSVDGLVCVNSVVVTARCFNATLYVKQLSVNTQCVGGLCALSHQLCCQQLQVQGIF